MNLEASTRKFRFYARGVVESRCLWNGLFRPRLQGVKAELRQYPEEEQAEIWKRVNHSNRLEDPFEVSPDAIRWRSRKMTPRPSYYFDLHRVLKYFPADWLIDYRFGDVQEVRDFVRLTKTRPIGAVEENRNNVLLKLNSVRHFRSVRDSMRFREKKDFLVWRGKAFSDHRKVLLRNLSGQPRCDVGHSMLSRPLEVPEWNRRFMSIPEQLENKFILSVEGNEVATNLKWIARSNSLCFMPRPRFESWFCEGRLEPGRHYVEVRKDFSDVPEKVDYFLSHPEEAEEIVREMKAYASPFWDRKKERLISILVMEKYFRLSGQLPS